MSQITDTRNALRSVVADLGDEVVVLVGPTDLKQGRAMGGVADMNYEIRIIVGQPNDVTDAIVDDLIEDVPQMFERHPDLAVQVLRTSGHRLYASGPSAPPRLGCEWTVKVVG